MKLLATLGAFLFSGIVAAATPLHNIVVFGDSLSDNGNLYEVMKHMLPQSPPYYEGRFSNGPVWIENLAHSYFPNDTDAHFQDYAYGGAGVSEADDDDVLFTLRREVNTYLLSHQDKADADTLYVVWIGANNYLGMPEEVEQTLKEVNEGIDHSLSLLAEKGAKHILVLNLPDLGRTPAAIEFDAVNTLTYYSQQHNHALDKTLDDLKQRYSNVNWLFFDLHSMFNDLLEYPEKYGVTDIRHPCTDSMGVASSRRSVLNMVAHVAPKTLDETCEGYLFFDLVHPTALAHRIMAEHAKQAIDEAGIEFSE